MSNQASVMANTGIGFTAQTLRFINHLFPAPRSFSIRLWDGSCLSADGQNTFELILNSPYALRRIFRPPLEGSAGIAFVRGDFDIEGDIFQSFRLLDTLGQISLGRIPGLLGEWLRLPTEPVTAHLSRVEAHLDGAHHSKARDMAAIQYHYDVGNDFYALFLDKRMIYSCAYFPNGDESLDEAQEKKLDLICRKLRLRAGEHLLDIGCGWGGLVLYAAEHYGVSALGVTLSQRQYELAQQRIQSAGLADRVKVELRDYRDIASGSFDKISSIGMFEHVGRSQMPKYFSNIYRLLKPGGLFLNHGISAHPVIERYGNLLQRLLVQRGSFTMKYIFPDSELMPVSEVNWMAERAGFEIRDVENLREHYALTLRQWVTRLQTHRDEAVKIANERLYRTWRLYMAGAVFGFETGGININQTLIAKPDHGKVSLPPSRADLYVS